MVWTTKPPLGTQLDLSHPLNYGLEALWIFNEGMGDKVNDLSGNGNNGTLTNIAFPSTPTSGWNPGRLGYSIMFDGSDDFISTLYPLSSGNKTIAYWIQPSSFGEYKATGVNDGSNHRLYLGTAYGNVYFGVGNSYKSNILHDMNINKWYHYVLVVDGTIATVYINGVQIDSLIYSQTGASTLPIVIGATNTITGTINYQMGAIDEVRIWNRPLTVSEIITLYINPYEMFLAECPELECNMTITL